MSKEWDKFQAEFKKLQPGIKKLPVSGATKIHAQLKKTLTKAWDQEDKFRDALGKAQKDGVKSEKLADFMKDKGFKDAHTTWKKAVETHHGEVDQLKAYCSQAAETHGKLTTLQTDIEKYQKKNKGVAPPSKEIEKLPTTLKKQIAELKKTKDAIGKLTAPEKLYAVNFKRTVDNILKKSGKSGKVSDADLPKLLEDKALKKNVKEASNLVRSITELCDSAVENAPASRKDATTDLKKAKLQIKQLKKLSTNYQNVKKKHPDKIKASKDAKKVLASIKNFASQLTDSEKKLKDSEAAVKKAA